MNRRNFIRNFIGGICIALAVDLTKIEKIEPDFILSLYNTQTGLKIIDIGFNNIELSEHGITYIRGPKRNFNF